MGKIALICTLGPGDAGVTFPQENYSSLGTVSILKHQSARDISVHQFLDSLKKLKLEPTELSMDLFVIACTMYAADTRINREKYAEDSWTRMIDLFIRRYRTISRCL
jgi:hypothetical protein